ncbi:MAG: hypothetical protein JRN68_02480 [Nitrososphaerota archaeon]|nr:hypothetical protein [Nitrososphaerota archaeon]
MVTAPRRMRISWLAVFAGLISLVAFFYLLNLYLNWSVMEHMYSLKAGLNWFELVFYHGYTFYVAAALALLVINPVPGRSDLISAINAVTSRSWSVPRESRFRTYSDYRFYASGQSSSSPPQGPFRISVRLWGTWQAIKYVIAYFVFAGLAGLPFFGNLVMPVLMDLQGYGSWYNIPRIFQLPFRFASADRLISLMPSMQIQYFLLFSVLGTVILILILRLVVRAVRDYANGTGNHWIRDLILIITCILALLILNAPYWGTTAASPYAYGALWSLVGFTVVGWLYLKLSGKGVIPITARRRRLVTAAGIFVAAVLVVNVGASAYIYLNWNNRWPQYEWTPFIQKEINVTDWSSGVQNLQIQSLQNLPGGNTSTILSLVRQWGQSQALLTMTKEIGAVNWMAPASSQVIWYNNTEYWVAPTTVQYPGGSQNWISEHLIYTHSDRVVAINTHSGQEVSIEQALNAPEPLIYYGENITFNNEVYVHVNGYNEINNESFPGTPDYILSGIQRAAWFFLKGPTTWGFAFSPPQNSIDMLYNRNIFNRVGDILINGLQVDPAAYLVTDGSHLDYVVQVYVSYPLNSGFSDSPYLRFFGVVLVDPTNGNMTGYLVPNQNYSDGFLMSFYRSYYSDWQQAPAWLVAQLRYPEALLGEQGNPGQLDYNFYFHVTNPFEWRSGSNFYVSQDANGNRLPLLYIAYTIGNKSYFVGLQEVEYMSSASKNLAGLYVVFGGDRLGQMYLYQTPSNFTGTLLGPTGAIQVVNTNPTVRQQETLLPNYVAGSTLLYVINGRLYYFIPFYTQPGGTSQVIAQMPFITAVDPSTGAVGVGPNALQAFQNLIGKSISGPPPSSVQLQQNVSKFFTDHNLQLLNSSIVTANLYIGVGNLTYTSPADWPTVSAALTSFISNYTNVYGSQYVVVTQSGNSTYDYGILVQKQVSTQPPTNILILYYIQIDY